MSAASNSARKSARPPEATVGGLLRAWRGRWGLSRAALAREAGETAGVLAGIEAGTVAATRDTLLALASALDLTLRDRNALLEAGGQAPIYKETDLATPAMAQARRAITLILTRHEPWPAFVTDRRWDVLAANDAAQRLLRLMLGEARIGRPMNLMRLFLAPDELRRQMANWPAAARALLRRARHEAMAAPLDEALQATWRDLLAYPDVRGLAADEADLSPGPLCEVRFTSQGRELGLIGTVATLAAPLDVTLDDLRIETFLPSDDESEALLLALAGGVALEEEVGSRE
ncbi:MAG: helix-turn-helix domain-containing protein [Caulobacter sp.]|nr:helix-turn-helix domain-containing protein [Caulobacter sp.]